MRCFQTFLSSQTRTISVVEWLLDSMSLNRVVCVPFVLLRCSSISENTGHVAFHVPPCRQQGKFHSDSESLGSPQCSCLHDANRRHNRLPRMLMSNEVRRAYGLQRSSLVGYTDFDFAGQKLVLQPEAYQVALTQKSGYLSLEGIQSEGQRV